MRYPNLRAEMARAAVGVDGICMYTGLSTATVYRRLHDGGFSIEEARCIQKRLFPNCSIDYLFADESEVMTDGQDSDAAAGG